MGIGYFPFFIQTFYPESNGWSYFPEGSLVAYFMEVEKGLSSKYLYAASSSLSIASPKRHGSWWSVFFDILPLSSLAQLTAFTKLLYLIITLEVNKQLKKYTYNM